MIGEVLAGLSALSSLFGSLKSAQSNKSIDRQLARRQSELDTWYNKEYNINYLDTEEARSIVQLLNRQREEGMKKVNQGNVIRGASDERRVATAEELNENIADSLTRLAGYGTRYKQGIRREYQQRKAGLEDLEYRNLQNKSEQWSNFMNNATAAGIGFAQAGGEGAFDKWEGNIANWFKARKLKKAGGMLNPVSITNIKMPKLYNQ